MDSTKCHGSHHSTGFCVSIIQSGYACVLGNVQRMIWHKGVVCQSISNKKKISGMSNVSCSRCTSLWCWLDISHITFSWFITGERIRIISSIAVEVRGRTILRERWVLELWIHFFRWRSETLRCCGHKRSAECYKSVGGSICFREAGTFWKPVYLQTSNIYLKFYNKQSKKMQQIWIFRVLNRWFFFHSARLGKATRQIASSELFVPRSLTGIGLGPSCFEKKTAGAVLLAHPGICTTKWDLEIQSKTCTFFVDPPEFRSKNQTSITWLFQSPQNVHPVSHLYEVWIEKNQTCHFSLFEVNFNLFPVIFNGYVPKSQFWQLKTVIKVLPFQAPEIYVQSEGF